MRQLKKTLPPPDSFFIEATVGWVELGNPREALQELAQVSPENMSHPQVLELKWQILARLENWEHSLPVAQAFCDVAPSLEQGWLHQAVSLYRLKRTEEAWNLLLPMAQKFPRSWVIPYDLACYACQLGKVDEARVWLKKAFAQGEAKEVKVLALADPDLRVLWGEIESTRFGKEKQSGPKATDIC